MATKLALASQALKNAYPLSVTETDYAAKGCHLEASIAPEKVVDAVRALDGEGFFLEAVTGVDWLTPKAPPKAPKAAEAGAEAAAPKTPGADAAAPKAAEAEAKPEEAPKEEMEVVYDFNHYAELCRVVLKVRIPRDAPSLPTISAVYPGANWHEREVFEFFGIIFENHPDLKPLLLPEDADFHPLRKDFVS